MSTSTIHPSESSDGSPATQQQLLELARHLDRFGRQTEQFLCQQLEQLERAIEEFEREKAAWRRQLRRESCQIAQQREEAKQFNTTDSSTSPLSENAAAKLARRKTETAEATARRSGGAPIRLLLQSHAATPLQAGLLLFEISKLNRDMGGLGLSFEIGDVRRPGKRLWTRHAHAKSGEVILELIGFSTQPLASRGTHVELDLDVTDRIERWIAFKARLLQTSLVNGNLAGLFRRARSVTTDGESRGFLREVTRRVDEAANQQRDTADYSSGTLFGNMTIDSVARQIERLEGCCERLIGDCGLRADIELLTGP